MGREGDRRYTLTEHCEAAVSVAAVTNFARDISQFCQKAFWRVNGSFKTKYTIFSLVYSIPLLCIIRIELEGKCLHSRLVHPSAVSNVMLKS